MKTQAQRRQELREAKLAQIEQDVRDGKLVIRQMTAAERAKHSPQPGPRGAARRT
jgi:hypothetical protein